MASGSEDHVILTLVMSRDVSRKVMASDSEDHVILPG